MDSYKLKEQRVPAHTNKRWLIYDNYSHEYTKTEYLQEIFGPVGFVFQDTAPRCDTLSLRLRRRNMKDKKTARIAFVTAQIHTLCAPCCIRAIIAHKNQAHTWISRAAAVFHQPPFGGGSVPPPCSTCGAIILWHTYLPLNDFSSSSCESPNQSWKRRA